MEHAPGKPIEIWVQDEARIGQQGILTLVWARRCTRPHGLHDVRYQWACLFGGVCSGRSVAASLVLPFANTAAMNAQLAKIARAVARRAGMRVG